MTTITTRRTPREQLARDLFADAIEVPAATRRWGYIGGYVAPQDHVSNEQIGVVVVDHGDHDEPQHACPACLGTGRRGAPLYLGMSPFCPQCLGYGGIGVHVNLDTVLWVLDQIVAGNVGKFFNSGYSLTLRERLHRVARAEWSREAVEDFDYDIEDADAVMQLAVMGEIHYS